jgi:hypothetical protein
MLSHFPTLTITQPAGLGARTASKFGGLPWGFPADAATPWPVCAECGCPMSFLAQFAPGPHVPRLGAAHSLFIFKCERDSICSFWEHDGGANACIVVPHAQMRDGFMAMPHGGKSEPAYRLAGADGAASVAAQDEDSPVLAEVWIKDWRAEDDGVPAELEPQFYDERFYGLPEAIAVPHGFESERCTKAGGVPYWTGNGNGCLPAELAEPGCLLLQIDTFLTVSDASRDELDSYAKAQGLEHGSVGGALDIANFCSDGIGYVMDRSPDAAIPSFYFMILR